MDNQKMANFIAILRKEKNLTQNDIALKLGITDRAVSKWERGLSCPDISLLKDLSNMLGVTIMELLNGELLEKKENVDNEKVIITMDYTKNNIKDKILNIIKKALIIFVICCSFFLILNIIYVEIKLNKKYYNPLYIKDKSVYNVVIGEKEFTNKLDASKYAMDEVDKKINLILSNKGNYNKDYDTVVKYVNVIKSSIDIDYDKNIYLKLAFSFDDFYKVTTTKIGFDLEGIIDYENIYSLLIKYNPEYIKHLDNYFYSIQDFRNSRFSIQNYVKKSYLFKDDKINVTSDFVNIYYLKYNLLNLVLSDIIEAGDINE